MRSDEVGLQVPVRDQAGGDWRWVASAADCLGCRGLGVQLLDDDGVHVETSCETCGGHGLSERALAAMREALAAGFLNAYAFGQVKVGLVRRGLLRKTVKTGGHEFWDITKRGRAFAQLLGGAS